MYLKDMCYGHFIFSSNDDAFEFGIHSSIQYRKEPMMCIRGIIDAR